MKTREKKNTLYGVTDFEGRVDSRTKDYKHSKESEKAKKWTPLKVPERMKTF